jgi:hypothetical protein
MSPPADITQPSGGGVGQLIKESATGKVTPVGDEQAEQAEQEGEDRQQGSTGKPVNPDLSAMLPQDDAKVFEGRPVKLDKKFLKVVTCSMLAHNQICELLAARLVAHGLLGQIWPSRDIPSRAVASRLKHQEQQSSVGTMAGTRMCDH